MELVKQFIGVERWQLLFAQIAEESKELKHPSLNTIVVLIALVVSATPCVMTLITQHNPEVSRTLPTVAFGTCALVALLLRRWLHLPRATKRNWKKSLSVTHTAVALGCIPVALIVFLAPNLLAERHTVLTSAEGSTLAPVQIDWFKVVASIVFTATWVAVIEELIFRGLLVSVLRRWDLISKQSTRDIIAIVCSAVVFGVAHYPTWGFYASIALVGLGTGFVLAYIATGEQLAPVVLYHFIFDVLSIGVSLFI